MITSCLQERIEFTIDNFHIHDGEQVTVHLTKPHVLHTVGTTAGDCCVALCVERVINCQDGCFYDEYVYDFPINCHFPILPPGEYRISVPCQYYPVETKESASVDFILEEVDDTYLTVLRSNMAGGCGHGQHHHHYDHLDGGSYND